MASSVPGATTVSPSGLSSSEAILATSLDEPMPTEAVSPPVSVADALAQRLRQGAHPLDGQVGVGGRGEVDVRLVDRDLLDEGGHVRQQGHDQPGAAAVGGEPGARNAVPAGQRRRASAVAIAERAPKARAS